MRTVCDTEAENPLELDGLEFIEFVARPATSSEAALTQLGFVKIGRHKRKAVSLYRQNQINFVVNEEPTGFAAKAFRQHGPSICALGFRTRHAQRAFERACARGARPLDQKPDRGQHSFPGIFGLGDAAVYFVDRYRAPNHFDDDFRYLTPEAKPKGRGLLAVDGVTAAVPRGERTRWSQFFKTIFNFSETLSFDVQGEHTGLLTQSLKSPCGKLNITFNEPTTSKSQVQEYLDQNRGPGFERVTLIAKNFRQATEDLKASGVRFFETPPGGQILTKNLFGPINFELIEKRLDPDARRASADLFFRTVEQDQARRGYL